MRARREPRAIPRVAPCAFLPELRTVFGRDMLEDVAQALRPENRTGLRSLDRAVHIHDLSEFEGRDGHPVRSEHSIHVFT